MTETQVREHADSDAPTIERAKIHAYRILSNHHGKDDAITCETLAHNVTRKLGPEEAISQSSIRDIIPEIREDYNLPISSCGNGYFVIQSEQEFREIMTRIEETIQTKKERQKELARAWHNE